MKKTITKNEFIHDIMDVRPDNFSYKGLEALFDYFEEMEESCDTELEFDPIAICCEFQEDFIEYFQETYDIEGDKKEVLEHLRDNTQVIEVDDDTIIIANY